MNEQYRKLILEFVNQNSGIKAVDLAMKVMGEINPVKFNSEEYHKTLENMVYLNQIIELEIILPNGLDRVKSTYFPRGCQIRINTNVSRV